jgi:hypothetical protein
MPRVKDRELAQAVSRIEYILDLSERIEQARLSSNCKQYLKSKLEDAFYKLNLISDSAPLNIPTNKELALKHWIIELGFEPPSQAILMRMAAALKQRCQQEKRPVPKSHKYDNTYLDLINDTIANFHLPKSTKEPPSAVSSL